MIFLTESHVSRVLHPAVGGRPKNFRIKVNQPLIM